MARPKKGSSGGSKQGSKKATKGEAAAVTDAASPAQSEETLTDKLRATSSHFDHLVNLIPSSYYFPRTPEEEVLNAAKYSQNKSNRAPKQDIKEASRKAKRARLDPSQVESVVDIQSKRQKQKIESNAINFGDDGPDKDEDTDEDSDEESDTAEDTTSKRTQRHVMEDASKEQLRKRLAERITQLRGQRKLPDKNKKRLLTPSEKRKKAREAAKKKAKGDALHVDDPKNDKPSVAGMSADGSNATVFSKFDFSTAKRVGQEKKKGASNPMQLLAKAEAEKQKLERLKSEDPEKAKAQIEKEQWKKAMLKAEGVKIKDDPKLLKKAIKRKEHKKAKTKKDWTERVEIVDKYKADKQKSRKTALKERTDGKVQRRMNRGKKPAPKKSAPKKKRPGFEK